MDRPRLRFLAQVAAAPLAPEQDPQYGPLLKEKANAELERQALHARAEEKGMAAKPS